MYYDVYSFQNTYSILPADYVFLRERILRICSDFQLQGHPFFRHGVHLPQAHFVEVVSNEGGRGREGGRECGIWRDGGRTTKGGWDGKGGREGRMEREGGKEGWKEKVNKK